MMEQSSLVGLIILLPLLMSVVNGIGGAIPWKTIPRIPGTVSGILASLAVFASFCVAASLFFGLTGHEGVNAGYEHFAWNWIQVGDLNLPMKFRMDGLNGLLCLVITGIGFLIHVYSVGYMSHDENPQRYFTYLNLFTASMLILVLGASMPILFIGWEGVGLCSYLLIGFWFEDIEKAMAGKKAFVMNRIGDLGFLLGMFFLFREFHTLDFMELKEALASHAPEVGFGLFTLITMLLFVGATGKSAQIPLFVWLPDAMAGPTPVSALIHAATMVTAGVYMCCRLGFLYSLAPTTSMVIAYVAVATAFVSATVAIVQNDIKKVLAYSTVSQLGFMFLAVGVGAYTVAVFHLVTHAFFKALMFLGSGSVIHACDGEQDMRKMGGLKGYMPITFWTFVAGTLAISGIPIWAGFFSKDEILWQTASTGNWALYIMALLTAGMTATYMGRLVVMTFLGENRSSKHVREHLHESPPVMTVPLIILAILATFGGFLGFPHIFWPEHNFLEHLLHGIVPENLGRGSEGMELGLMAVSICVGAGCLYLSKVLFLNKPQEKETPLTDFLYHSWYLNEFYEAAVVRPLGQVAVFLWKVVDVIVIDGAVLLTATVSRVSGRALRRIHTGHLEHYLAFLMVGMLALLLILVTRVI